MKPEQEVASLDLCRRLNTAFGPPKNPAWWWVHGLDEKYRLVPDGYGAESVGAQFCVPAWTMADLCWTMADLCWTMADLGKLSPNGWTPDGLARDILLAWEAGE